MLWSLSGTLPFETIYYGVKNPAVQVFGAARIETLDQIRFTVREIPDTEFVIHCGGTVSYTHLDQQTRDTIITPKRGVIYDTNMKELAVSATAETVYIAPVDIKEEQEEAVAKALSETLALDYETVLGKTKNKKSYYQAVSYTHLDVYKRQPTTVSCGQEQSDRLWRKFRVWVRCAALR